MEKSSKTEWVWAPKSLKAVKYNLKFENNNNKKKQMNT